MTDFERILDNCLREMEQGASSVDDCLTRYPDHAEQLKPILLTASHLAQGRSLQPSAAFKARTRAKLSHHMQAHPRRRAQFGFGFRRLATGLVVIVLTLLATGTAYAQDALPGDPLYEWKLVSERAWRAVSPDPVAVDIAIANRRIGELNSVSEDPVRREQALEGYLEVVTRLETELDEETLKRILPVIDPLEDSEQLTTPAPTDPSAPEATRTPEPATVPEPTPTILPEIIPTIPFPLPPLLP